MLGHIALISFACLIAVWILYPIVIAAIASRKRVGTNLSNDGDPMVSVVIATRDDAGVVQSRVADCMTSDYDPAKLEVVVAVDRQCPDAAAVDSYSPNDGEPYGDRCKVVVGDEPGGKAATLNAAVRASHGDILVFTDAHQRFEPDAIRHLVSSLRDPRTGASSGSLELSRRGQGRSVMNVYWTFERWLRRCEARVHSSVGVTGAIWALQRSLWTPLPPHLILDDVYAPMQIVLRGYHVGFAERARAIDTRRTLPGQEYRRKVRTLTGVIQLCVKLPAVLLPSRNPIWPQFMLHKLLRLLTPYWVLAIVAWASVLVSRWVLGEPLAAAGLLIAALVAAFYTQGKVGSAMARVRAVVKWGVLLQAAIVVATANGIRRRWDVWRA